MRRVRTTITIDDALYRRLKARAAASGRTVSGLVEDAVRQALVARGREPAALPPLPVFGGGGVLPGVDLTSNAALREHMDAEAPVDAVR
jgi:hypothetical protein